MVSVRKRGKVYQYQYDIAPIDGKRKRVTKSRFKTKAEAEKAGTIAYNEKHQFYTLYLIDDKEYELYDEDNKKIGNVTGLELENYVLQQKKEIDSLYSK